MKTAERMKYLAWKSGQKTRLSDLKNERREEVARIKWKKENMTWGHEHPKR